MSQSELSDLVDRLVRSHKVCRLLYRSQALSQSYLELVEQIRQQLLIEFQQTVMQEGSSWELDEVWLCETLDRVCQTVLDDGALTRLAIVAQQQPPKTPFRKEALTVLIQAIESLGQLRRNPGNELQQRITQETLSHVVHKIDQYKPDKGPVMAWVLDSKKWIQWRVKASAEEPGMQQSAQTRRIKLKSKLKGLIRKAKQFDLWYWFSLEIKGLLPKREAVQVISRVSLVLTLMLDLQEQEPEQVSALLTQMAYEHFPIATRVEKRFGEGLSIDDIPFKDEPLLLSELVREYFQENFDELCQEVMQTYPQATFKVIAIERIDGKSWEEISARLGGIPISSLCGFYTKRLKKLAPRIKAYIQQNN